MSERRGRGRPTTGERVAVRLPPELLERIDTLAAVNGVARAEQIRRLLTDASEVGAADGAGRQF